VPRCRDHEVERCARLWAEVGVSRTFLAERPAGVRWDCDVCDHLKNSSSLECFESVEALVCKQQQELCLTCTGYPPGHSECSGLRFDQFYPNIPRAMWFMMVTFSTVGYGDLTPQTWRGQIFGAVVIISGVIFLAMPLAIVGRTFNSVWDEREVSPRPRGACPCAPTSSDNLPSASLAHPLSTRANCRLVRFQPCAGGEASP
jgi:hypothetical protein